MLSGVVRRRFASNNRLFRSLPRMFSTLTDPMVISPPLLKKSRVPKEPFVLADRQYRGSLTFEGIHMVTDTCSAKTAAAKLASLSPDTTVSWHLEYTDTDRGRETLFDHGTIVSLTGCTDTSPQLTIFIDCWGDASKETLPQFHEYFASANHPKVFHDFHTAAHLLNKHGILINGLMASTRYLARLVDTSLASWEGKETAAKQSKHLDDEQAEDASEETGYGLNELVRRYALHRGPGNTETIPIPDDAAAAHVDRRFFNRWVQQCAQQATFTLELFNYLRDYLINRTWKSEDFPTDGRNLWDFAQLVMKPLTEYLVDIERRGFAIDQNFLGNLRDEAAASSNFHANGFREAAAKLKVNAAVDMLNPRSTPMMRQLLFGGCSKKFPASEAFKVEAVDGPAWIKVTGIGLSPLSAKKSLKYFTKAGVAKVGHEVLAEYAGKDPINGQVGKAFDQLVKTKGSDYAQSVCEMLWHAERWVKSGALINGVVDPINERLSKIDDRLHCSLTLDTSTGRLVSRKPNLQNPPSTKLREAFVADAGKTLLVADYSQLELRILAHVSKCESMIKNLNAGGDYHSQTAVEMFPEIASALNSGEITIGDIKAKYSTQRAQAKTLNFSIVYGKSVKSLAEDLLVSVTEAADLLESWFRSKPEVRAWNCAVVEKAKETGFAYSILGRPRVLPHIFDPRLGNKSARAAANHCIQGSAADIALCAMLRVKDDDRLRDLGFKMVLQVHDEFILEGPEEHAEVAKSILKELMENPFSFIDENYKFRVPMLVDAGIGKSWAEAKP